MSALDVERLGESGGHCDCCGNDSHMVWGLVHSDKKTLAAYWMSWSDGHLADIGASLEMVIGAWGDEASPSQRSSVSLWHKVGPDGSPAVMVVDAAPKEGLSAVGLRREEVIETPLAKHVFALVDAIYEQDGRFF